MSQDLTESSASSRRTCLWVSRPQRFMGEDAEGRPHLADCAAAGEAEPRGSQGLATTGG